MILLVSAAVFVAGTIVYAVRDRLARRRRRHMRHFDRPFRCRALFAVADRSLERGRLHLAAGSGGEVRWQARRDRAVVNLDDARVLSATVKPGGTRVRPGDVLLRLRLGGGLPARIVLHESDAAVLIRWMSDHATPRAAASTDDVPALADRPVVPRRRVQAATLLGMAGLWLAGWVYLVAFGDTVRATVVGGDGTGICTVAWSDNGLRRTSDVDCSGEPPGSTRSVWTLAWPLRAEALDPAWTVGGVLVIALVPAAIGGGLWYADRRRPRPALTRTKVSPAEPPADLPELDEDDLLPVAAEPAATMLARLAPYAVRQLPPDGWEDPRRPGGVAVRSTPRQIARRLGPPLVTLAILALLTAPWPYRWVVLHTHSTAVVAGVSTGEQQSDGPGPVPAEVTVRFRTGPGVDARADVATNQDLPADAAVIVRYAVDAPGWARLEGQGDGLDRGAGFAVAGAALLLAWAASRLADLAAGNHAVRHALSGRRRPALALLTATLADGPLLLICDPVVVPVRLLAVPLQAPLPHGAAAAFPSDAALGVTALGRLAEGEPIVAQLPGPASRLLLPAVPAVAPAPELLAVLLDSAGALDRAVEAEDGPA